MKTQVGITFTFDFIQTMNRKTTCDRCEVKIFQYEYVWVMQRQPYLIYCKPCMQYLRSVWTRGNEEKDERLRSAFGEVISRAKTIADKSVITETRIAYAERIIEIATKALESEE